MLVLHTSDWHLGRSLHRADLSPAFEMWSRHVVDLVKERRIDAVLISGDVYDRAVPPTSAVELFDRTLAELAELTTVVLTSGNHDSPQRLGFGSSLMRPNVHIRTDARRCGRPVEIVGRDGNRVFVYPIPYLDPDVERRRLAPSDPTSGDDGAAEPLGRSHEAVLAAALKLVSADVRSRPQDAGAFIVMAHAFISGGKPADSERDISVGGVDSAPSGLFRLGEDGPGPLSYVALGHLHSPQRVGRPGDPPMRYSGSPVAFSFSETAPKSSVLLHIDGKRVETETVPAPVWREVRTLAGRFEDLLAQAPREPADAFFRIVVTDPSRPANMAARIYGAFDNVLELRHTPEGGLRSQERADSIAAMAPLDILSSFMAASGNRDLTDEERAILAQTWEAARLEGKRR